MLSKVSSDGEVRQDPLWYFQVLCWLSAKHFLHEVMWLVGENEITLDHSCQVGSEESPGAGLLRALDTELSSLWPLMLCVWWDSTL